VDHYKIKAFLKCDAGANNKIYVQLNADTGSNYLELSHYIKLDATHNDSHGGASYALVCDHSVNQASDKDIDITISTMKTAYKSIMARSLSCGVTGGVYRSEMYDYGDFWQNNTDQVTSIKLTSEVNCYGWIKLYKSGDNNKLRG
jgi:hypothetical protein